MIDRASILCAAIFCVVRTCGTGAEARAEVVALLRAEFDDIQRTTLSEIRLREDE